MIVIATHLFTRKTLQRRLLLLAGGLLLWATGLPGQVYFHPSSQQLPQQSATALAQDKLGFLWVGTRYGLHRYDGYDFYAAFPAQDSVPRNSANVISSLLVAQDSNLWVGTNGGGLRFLNYQSLRYEPLPAKNADTLAARVVNALAQDSGGHIWIGTQYQGLWQYRPAQKRLAPVLPQKRLAGKTLAELHITALAPAPNNRLWIGTWSSGLLLYHGPSGSLQQFTPENSPGLRSRNIRALHYGPQGQLLVGSGAGLLRAYPSGEGFRFETLLGKQPVGSRLQEARVLSLERKGAQVWAGTENEGLFALDLSQKSVTQYKHQPNNPLSLCSNSIWALFQDDRKVLWIGTFNQGLCKVDPHEQKFPPPYRSSQADGGLRSNVVSAFAEAGPQQVWVGTEGGGLHRFSGKEERFTVFQHDPARPASLSSNYVVCLEKDAAGRLWVGTWEGGLNLKRPGNQGFRHFKHRKDDPNSPANDDIYTLHAPDQGGLWLSCYRAGVDFYDARRDTFIHYSTRAPAHRRIGSDMIRALTVDDAGYLWLGSEAKGLFRLKLNNRGAITERRVLNRNNSDLESNYITSIRQDSRGLFWIGTEGGGLYYGKDPAQNLTKLSRQEGLSGNIVYAVEKAGDSLLWISTNRGLSVYDRARGQFRNHFTSPPESPGFYRPSSLLSQEGYLYFGGIRGFLRFAPDQIPFNKKPPRVYLRDFKLQRPGDSATSSTALPPQNPTLLRKATLKHWQNDLRFELAALNYSANGKNQYAYRLAPLDDYLHYTANPRGIVYNNLPPGDYELQIKAANNDGVWSSEKTALKLHIAPPWYQTPWAYAGYSLLAVGLLILGRYHIIRNERLRSRLALEHQELEHAQELNRVREKFFTYISHEFRTPLTLIMAPLREMLDQNPEAGDRHKLTLMLQNAKRLLLLINQILDLSKLENDHLKLEASRQDLSAFLNQVSQSFRTYADQQNILFDTQFPRTPLMVYFDHNKLEKVLVNLLSNAFKFTPAYGKISLRLESEGGQAFITVQDTGRGIPPEEIEQIFQRYYQGKRGKLSLGTGIGLTLSRELVEMHHGKLAVKSPPAGGASFTVSLPLGKSHLQPEQIVRYQDDWAFRRPEPATDPALDFEAPAMEEPEVPGDGQVPEKPVLLIVEDNIDLQVLLQELFQSRFRLLLARDGQEGLALAQEEIPDLIISDIIMPRMDGHQFTEEIKAQKNTSHIPVILLTARTSSSSQARGLESGAIFYITKPFDPHLLKLRVQNIMDNLQEYKENIRTNKGIKLEPSKVHLPDPDTEFLQKAMDIINEHLADPHFQVSHLSEELHMSKAQLYRKMKGLLGCSTNAFIRITRLKRAAQLLRQGHLTIAETTYQVGFNDLQYFRKCFVEQYGLTPSEYATRHQSSP
jgi:signal transduction histidine kinase/ligand-binding sensor domain-containing protein/DNA-binding response OmpR family regulator